MTQILGYDNLGKISCVYSGNVTNAANAITAYGHNYIVLEQSVNHKKYYVENDALVAIPPAPSDLHYFDYTTKTWQLDEPTLNVQALADLRRTRNDMLRDTDWTQVPDAPVDAIAWRTYRQQLRDLPSAYPDIISVDEVTWPTPPA